MNIAKLDRRSEHAWEIPKRGRMRVPAVVYASEALVREMDEKVAEQITNVACLPGIVEAAYAMPDAHWGYGFPIGGVAAFDPEAGGVVSAGGVGFDISCGVRALKTGLRAKDVERVRQHLARRLSEIIPAGVGSTGELHLSDDDLDKMLENGARWAVERGYGRPEDLDRIEEMGRMAGAIPSEISRQARRRQQDEMGTLGSGNHYMEVQRVSLVYDVKTAEALGFSPGDVIVSLHCGSRGLGHQVGTEFVQRMAEAAPKFGIDLPERDLACAPLQSPLAKAYLGAMRAAINCALANRQILTQLARRAFAEVLPQAELTIFYDVSHNTCKLEEHEVGGRRRPLFVHRKGATRAFGPGRPELPEALRGFGQPVLIGGTMGTASHILLGTPESETRAFASAAHGAGRAMSRHEAARHWSGSRLVKELAQRGILVESPSMRGIAEEAPGAYKDVDAVALATEKAGLARRLLRLEPMVCVKG